LSYLSDIPLNNVSNMCGILLVPEGIFDERSIFLSSSESISSFYTKQKQNKTKIKTVINK